MLRILNSNQFSEFSKIQKLTKTTTKLKRALIELTQIAKKQIRKIDVTIRLLLRFSLTNLSFYKK
jgi:hypothetical protein